MALRSPYLALLVGAIVTLPMSPQKPATTATGKVSVAHRGASSYAPEHTGAAYRLAIQQGADYVEQDLAVTRDSGMVAWTVDGGALEALAKLIRRDRRAPSNGEHGAKVLAISRRNCRRDWD